MASPLRKLNSKRKKLEAELTQALERLKQLSSTLTTNMNRSNPSAQFQDQYVKQILKLSRTISQILAVQEIEVTGEFRRLERAKKEAEKAKKQKEEDEQNK